ncbi:MAG TPA: hypothetical protein DD381_01320 [Lentisphaeria bacterium]|nr:MAG: hypothetical protein A2X47_10710 [Lentisphaerae bacterium GWF2_38_69]HBM14984.1 hypothetical protein [Lentisphaeria bacterium]
MGRKSFLIKILTITIIIISLFVYLIAHLYYLQIDQHKELYEKAKKKYTAVKKMKGSRGEIYDREGNLLVGNIPCVDVRADPNLIGDKYESKKTARFFASKLKIPYGKLLERFNRKKIDEKEIHEVIIKNQISLDEANYLKEEIKKKKIKGIFFFDSTKRYYPKDELLSNVLGFINSDDVDSIPISGIESAYNSILSPAQSNLTVYERTRDGIPLSYGNNRFEDKKEGDNIYLTIHEPLQSILEEELDKLMEKWKPKTVYAVMVEPSTGSIIAMGQRPSFNPNNRASMDTDNWQNKIVTQGFEPGSIMKPLVIAKALDSGVMKQSTIFDCEKGRWFYAGKILRDSHPYEKLTVAEIIQKSSNIGTAKIALELGKKELYDLFVDYGFGQETGLPFDPEATGILRKYEKWDSLSVTRFPIGQGILTTPVQILSAYTALANGGVRMKLRIVDKIESSDNGKLYNFPIKKGERIFSEETATEIVEMMKLVTETGGTATKAHIPGFKVAGKTGTAQKWVNGEYSHSQFVASFIGFVPADNPAFVLLVSLDEPQGASYGGIVSAPAFAQIAEKALKYMDIMPTEALDANTAKNQ